MVIILTVWCVVTLIGFAYPMLRVYGLWLNRQTMYRMREADRLHRAASPSRMKW